MNRCPITYQECGEFKYSPSGLKLLSPKLAQLHDFPYTPKQQVLLAAQLSEKMSIQGVQPKLSVILNLPKETFEIVEQNGTFILKPPHQIYDELPQNEDLTMKLASIVGIEVPLHGMVYNADRSLTYFIKRFDRLPKNQKLAVEDFSQLLKFSRETKYDASMEKMIPVIEKHCTFPMIEKLKFFRLVLFNFLVGNEDMHIKNYSLIRRKDRVELSPAYDLLNTTIVLNTKEEIALPLRGKKSRLNRSDLIDYFAIEKLSLTRPSVEKIMKQFHDSIAKWEERIAMSFLSQEKQNTYREILHSRWRRISE